MRLERLRLPGSLLPPAALVLGLLAVSATNNTAALFIVTAVLLALLRWPVVALVLLPLAVPFASLLPIGLGGANVSAADGLVLLLLATAVARGVAAHRVVLPRVSLAGPLVVMYAAVLFSILDAFSIQAFIKEMVKWLELGGIYVLTASEMREENRRLVLLAFFAAATAEAGIGIYQYLFHAGPKGFLFFGGQELRAYGTFEQPNPFAGYLALVAPIALGVLLRSLDANLMPSPGLRKTSTNRGPSVLRALALIALVSCLLAIYMSLSRGAWLAVGGALAVTAMLTSRRAAAGLTAAAIILVLVALLGEFDLMPSFITDRFAPVSEYFRIFDARKANVTDANFAIVERMAHWQAAWGMFTDHPFTGVGFGSYAAVYPAYALPRWSNPLGHAHNYVLNLLAETGLVGTTGYLLFWAATFGLGWRALQEARQRNPTWQLVAAGLLGSLVALTIHNLFDDLYVHSMQLQVGMVLGMLEAIKNG